ncbi:MAG: Dabb family protein [Bauldia sp.]|jgi:hypothetical protein|nr:MAG: Dabb family protein [Bauldia sp.]
MIRHCVFVRFRREITAGERAQLLGEIAELKDRLTGLVAVHIGANVSPEEGMDKGYADGFMVDFRNAAARDAYLADPVHQTIGRKLVAAAQGGVEGVLVYDLELARG